MTASAVVRVDGARQLRRNLKRAGADLDDLKEVHAAVAEYVAVRAAAAAPRRTGRLAGTVRGNRARARATVSAGRASVPYAGPIHWGWPARGIREQPWIADAARALEPQWTGMYEQGVARVLSEIEGA